MGQIQKSLTDNGVFLTSSRKFPVRVIVGGIVLLVLGVLGGVILGKFIFVSKISQFAITYEECVNLKGSVVTLSYPGVCITQDGKRFVQPLEEEEQVVCGGWNTGGEVVCDCSGKLIKPDCPSGAICDSGDYLCQGQCGNCCWRGAGDGVQYGGPYPVCGSNSEEKATSGVEGKFCGGIAGNLPENQCPVGYRCQLDGNYPDAGGKCVKE